ncbi:NAD-dependent epimerase/dehydratase family protein [Prochlorococcus sp. MIT 1201]|uniref:NAD-dependent epimerase/dehydratase family protein n=1 Tax=Prochlorococcus sp. MIT 1201 TaxID=3082535 RepID=UPI0039A4269E
MVDMKPVTVLGAAGWIGSALVSDLRRRGREVMPVDRAELPAWLARDDQLGPVIYAIGLTADFRERPFATAEAHVGLLSQVLQRSGLSQLLLLSSTRVYSRSRNTNESVAVPCLSSDPSDLYNLSKLMGEALVLQDPRPGLKVARISNVVGAGQPSSTFVGSLLEEARGNSQVMIEQPAGMAKDYVALADVVRLLPLIAVEGRQRLYNLGSGFNTSHAEVADWLESQGVHVCFVPRATGDFSFPPLSIERLSAEFDPPGAPFQQTLLQS